MPVALGFHTDVQTQAALNDLLAEVQAERKRAVVVQGAQGRMITVLSKGNPIAELLRSLTGQTRREAQRLEQFRASLPQGPQVPAQQAQVAQAVVQAVQPPLEQPGPEPAVQIVHDAALDAALEAAHASLLPPASAQSQPQPPAAQATVQAVAAEPAGAAAVAQYVERQGHDPICLKHSIAAYYNRPVFAGTQDFIAFRDSIYRGMGDIIEPADFGHLSTTIYAVRDMLEAMRLDAQRDNTGIDVRAPWSQPFKLDVDRRGKPKKDPQDAQELDVQFERFARESASNRFIVRTGSGQSGHFWFLSRDPALGRWTMANSTGAMVAHGDSPSRLLEQDGIRRGEIFVWTQLKGDPDEVNRRFQDALLRGEPPQALPPEPQTPAAQERQEELEEDLPPPILPPGYRPAGQAAQARQTSMGPAVQGPLWPQDPIEGVDPALQRAVMADLADTQAPQLRQSWLQLDQALADLRQNHPARYASLKRAIDADLNALIGAPRPSADQIARIRANLRALDECSHRWRGADARMDAAGMNYLRAANAVRHESQASDAERARRAAVGTLLNASRRILATDYQAARFGQRLPASWTETQSRDAQAIYRSAQTLGLEDAAVLPLWLGSIEEGSHQQFIAEAVAVLERWR